MQPAAAESRQWPLISFFVLVFAGTIPFWILGASGWQLLPGLPVSGLAAVCPAVVALALRYRQGGRGGAVSLLARSFDVGRIRRKIWCIPILLLAPTVRVLSLLVMTATGVSLPVPDFFPMVALALFVGFFVGALGEELGWSGYTIEPMQQRWGALVAALILGTIWAGWHVIALLQAHRSFEWIAFWTLGTISARVIMVWLYNNTGRSVFAVTLFHTMSNLSWQISPNLVAYYDPRINGPVLAVLATIVVLAFGPLSRLDAQSYPTNATV
jgi:membrane protease YdiL (CAAX protease family)